MLIVFAIFYAIFWVVFKEFALLESAASMVASFMDFRNPTGYGHSFAENWMMEAPILPAVLITYKMYGRTPNEQGM